MPASGGATDCQIFHFPTDELTQMVAESVNLSTEQVTDVPGSPGVRQIAKPSTRSRSTPGPMADTAQPEVFCRWVIPAA